MRRKTADAADFDEMVKAWMRRHSVDDLDELSFVVVYLIGLLQKHRNVGITEKVAVTFGLLRHQQMHPDASMRVDH